MNKILIKTFLIIFVLSVVLVIPNKIYAVDEVISGGKGFIEEGSGGESLIDKSNLKTTSDTIYNILLATGVVIAVLVGAVLGIQFMVGGMEEQAKVKESLIPFIVGSIIVFGAFGIWKLVASIAQTL